VDRAVERDLSEALPAGTDSSRLLRFDAVERGVHWLTAALVLTLVVTGAILYVPSLERLVGEREIVERIHVLSGFALPAPLAFGLLGRAGRRLRADLRRLNRLDGVEWRWLRRFGRAPEVSLGKFNPGQKLIAALFGGSLVAMFLTGLVLDFAGHFPLAMRSGATFVHELVAWIVVVLVVGHILMALAHPGSLRSMVVGWVDDAWAGRHAPAWRSAVRARPSDADAPVRPDRLTEADWRPEPPDA